MTRKKMPTQLSGLTLLRRETLRGGAIGASVLLLVSCGAAKYAPDAASDSSPDQQIASTVDSGMDSRADVPILDAGRDGEVGDIGEVVSREVGSDVADAPTSSNCAPEQSTRACYTGRAGSAGMGPCKNGTQSCDSDGHWQTLCAGEITPTPETCDSIDNDCDGQVDNIPRTAQSSGIALSTLQAKNAACIDTNSTWLACNNAVHLYCKDIACRTSGVGPLEGDPAVVAFDCLTSPPTMDVTAATLAPFGTCPVSPNLTISDHFPCAKAIHGYCQSQGFASGYGPVASPQAGQWTIVCLATGHALPLRITYADLSAAFQFCTDYTVLSSSPFLCTVAAKRYCNSQAHPAGGFGPVADPDGKSPTIVCLSSI
jgi:hypothetical protein